MRLMAPAMQLRKTIAPPTGTNRILLDMLSLSRSGISRSRLLSNWTEINATIKSCICYLLSQGMIEENRVYVSSLGEVNAKVLRTTEKGLHCLKTIDSLLKLAGNLGD